MIVLLCSHSSLVPYCTLLVSVMYSYSQEFPKRFQKDVVKAATINSRQLNVQAVSAEGISHVLQNIGMAHRMSRSEIEGIVSEVGSCPLDEQGQPQCVISANQMLDLISKNWEEHHHEMNQPRFDP